MKGKSSKMFEKLGTELGEDEVETEMEEEIPNW
jgi:hypothetical protein